MATDDFFHARLDTTIDLRNPLAKLAQRMRPATLLRSAGFDVCGAKQAWRNCARPA